MQLGLIFLIATAGASRFERTLGADHGLDAGRLGDVVEGTEGLLWASSPVGVFHFDGRQFERAAANAPPVRTYHLAPRPEGGVYAADSLGRLWAIDRGSQRRVDLPDDRKLGGATLGVDGSGALWVLRDRTLWRRGTSGAWTRPADALWEPGEAPNRLVLPEGRLLVVTNRGVVDLHDEPRRALLTPGSRSFMAAAKHAGAWYTLEWNGIVRRYGSGEVVRGEGPVGRGITRVGDTLYLDWDHTMATVDANGVLGPEVPWTGHAPIQVADGSVWWAGPNGLSSWPEPRTTLFDEAPVLPGGRFVTARRSHTWFVSWTGAIRLDDGVPTEADSPPIVRSPVCLDGDGVAWATGQRGPQPSAPWVLVRWDPAGPTVVRDLAPNPTSRCITTDAGDVWLSGREGPLRVGPDALDRLAAPIEAWRIFFAEGSLWISDHRQLCHAPPVPGVDASVWQCFRIDDSEVRTIEDLRPNGYGSLWIASEGAGLLELAKGQLRRMPDSDTVFGTRTLYRVIPSPRGGHWVVGNHALHRVEGPHLTVLETLGRSHGLPAAAAEDLAELPDGDLWISTQGTLAHVPAAVRELPPPPPLHILSLQVDGEERSGARVSVPSPPNLVSIHATALAFRAPEEVRIRVTVDAGRAWEVTDGPLQLVDLPPGPHTVALASSLDGTHWSTPVVRHIVVVTPWWRRWWAIGAMGCSIVGVVALLARGRVAWQLAQERARLRLAMDLHDELGSGLGSLRLLLGPLQRPDLDPSLRSDMVARLRSVTGDLHASLQEIVGSLRPGGSTVGALADRLWRRGRNLLPGGELHVTLAPAFADRSIPLTMCRELERIGAEALHNAARHAKPSLVEIGIEDTGPALRLWVSDDGPGIQTESTPTGLGLASIRARAERMGGELTITSRPLGTTIEVNVPWRGRWR
ncbi:MAG: ATP-binding protein [Myxococcota bacterium]